MFRVYVRLDKDELVFVAAREDSDQAANLARELGAFWPHQYVVRDSRGEIVEHKTGSDR